jgi:predicted dipeptidase
MKKPLVLLMCPLLVAVSLAQKPALLVPLLQKRGAELVEQANVWGRGDSRSVYTQFVRLVAGELERQGDKSTAGRLLAAVNDPSAANIPKTELSWITHTYAREMYKDQIIQETAQLVKFKTYATDVPNRQNPEFIKHKNYLKELCDRLGLHFRDIDGYVQEIWIGDGPVSFGLMSHSDVQPVELSEWKGDPWSGAISDEAIWGRGSVDDKGPIVAIMYGMRALLDTGFPLKKKIILLVGTDEESANEDIATYLKSNKAPDQTIVVDSNYPVICAEKGWCGAWLELPLGVPVPSGEGLVVVHMESGFSASIVPERATAKLVAIGSTIDRYLDITNRKADEFVARRKGAKLSIRTERDTLVITAYGKSVHGAVPETGHNALMDLVVFLDRYVKPLKNEYALMTNFAATYIGFELDGKSLGITYRDSFMGGVSVAACMFQKTDSTVMFMFNFRIPRGISRTKIESELQKRYRTFNRMNGTALKTTHYISDPLYTDPKSPFVQRLLGIYNSITGERRKAESIGGGTYAHRVPNAVVFGPALPDEEYLGHQPNENFKISTLIKNIEILTHTMFDFGM